MEFYKERLRDLKKLNHDVEAYHVERDNLLLEFVEVISDGILSEAETKKIAKAIVASLRKSHVDVWHA